MLTLILGIAIGALFSPVWMKVWAFIKAHVPFLNKPAVVAVENSVSSVATVVNTVADNTPPSK